MMKQAILKTLAIAILVASINSQRAVGAEVASEKFFLLGSFSSPNPAIIYSPSPSMIQGMKDFAKGDSTSALSSFNTAIQANPQDSQVYHNRSGVYIYMHLQLNGESEDAAKNSEYLDKALIDANQAVKLDPKNFFAWRNRGQIRGLRGDLYGASSDYIVSYNIFPLPATALLRGLIFARMGDKQSALALLYEASIGLKAQGKTDSYQMALDEIKKLEKP
jgi:tetratricopeptide (TPR) repeat protein